MRRCERLRRPWRVRSGEVRRAGQGGRRPHEPFRTILVCCRGVRSSLRAPPCSWPPFSSAPTSGRPRPPRRGRPGRTSRRRLAADGGGPVQTDGREAAAKSVGCIVCHKETHDPHEKTTVHLGCTDCHGGDADGQGRPRRPRPAALPRSLANVGQAGALLHLAQPRVAGVRPLRQPRRSAHRPHQLRHRRLPRRQVGQVRKSMMTHGCMLWGAALYNNGAVPEQALPCTAKATA